MGGHESFFRVARVKGYYASAYLSGRLKTESTMTTVKAAKAALRKSMRQRLGSTSSDSLSSQCMSYFERMNPLTLCSCCRNSTCPITSCIPKEQSHCLL